MKVYCLAAPEGAVRLESRLSEAERTRANRFRRDSDRALYLGAHVLLHYALTKATGRSRFEFVVQDSGKPFLDEPGAPHFSLSHCPGMALCAVSDTAPVGADVEDITRGSIDRSMAEAVFCPEECDWYRNERERFFRIWTMKEAVFKTAGEVWTGRWHDFSVLPALTGVDWPEIATEQRFIGPDLLAAVALRKNGKLRAEWITLDHPKLQDAAA